MTVLVKLNWSAEKENNKSRAELIGVNRTGQILIGHSRDSTLCPTVTAMHKIVGPRGSMEINYMNLLSKPILFLRNAFSFPPPCPRSSYALLILSVSYVLIVPRTA